MGDKQGSDTGWKHRYSILVPLLFPHDDLVGAEVDVLHQTAETLQEAQGQYHKERWP
jgi:hypothetical protein